MSSPGPGDQRPPEGPHRRHSAHSASTTTRPADVSPVGSPASHARFQLPTLSSPPPLADRRGSQASVNYAPRRRSSAAYSMRSFVTVAASPLPSPSLDPSSPGLPLSPDMPTGTPQDPFIVCFEADDPDDPRQWSTAYRWFLMACAASEMTGGTLAISIFTSGFAHMKAEFDVEREIIVLGTSLYMFGLALSSLVTAPLGELYGRKPVVAVSFLLFTLTSMGVALAPNAGALLALRFVSGFFGSASMSHAPAMAADLFAPSEVALPLTLAGVGRFGGPVIGPLIGGWIDQRAGWRWLAWTMTAFAGALTFVATFVVPETYAPAILRKRARALALAVGATHVTVYDAGRAIGGWKDEAKLYLVRPFLFLTLEPIVFLLSLHVSFLYGILNLYFSAYPYIFSTERGWSAGMAGLPFIAVLIGFVISIPIALRLARVYSDAAARSPDGKAAPEQRLLFGILGAGLLPISLFWLGWSATGVHWMAPVASGVIFSVGQLGLTQSVFTYFADVYGPSMMGSVLAGSNFMRFGFGAITPLFALQMFVKLGAGWACTLLGLLCVVFFPAPIIFFVYGARIRARSRYIPLTPSVDDDLEKASPTPSASVDPTPAPSRAPSPAARTTPTPSRPASRTEGAWPMFDAAQATGSAVDDVDDGAMSRLSSRRGQSRRPSVVREAVEPGRPA